MRKVLVNLRNIIHFIAQIIEIAVAAIIAFVIAVCVILMLIRVFGEVGAINDAEKLSTFLSDALSIIIGVEFLKMIVIPTADNVIDTLMFAVSRQIIIDHSITVTLIGIICIAILFMTRKYMFKSNKRKFYRTFKPTTRVKTVNILTGADLPTSSLDTDLNELVAAHCESESIEPEEGIEIDFDKAILKLGKIESEKIENIKIIIK